MISEAGVDLVLIETFPYVNDAILMLISRYLHKKSSEVSIKTRSIPASISFKGKVTKHTTVKWYNNIDILAMLMQAAQS